MIASIVVAASDNDIIGRDGALPWHLPADMRRFRLLTTGHVVVMGRVTYDSIHARLGQPLPDRTSIVVTRSRGAAGTGRVRVAVSLEAGLNLAATTAAASGDSEYFILGGESVYRESLPSVGRIYLTRVHAEVEGDRSMPAGWLDGFELQKSEAVIDHATALPYEFLDYERTLP